MKWILDTRSPVLGLLVTLMGVCALTGCQSAGTHRAQIEGAVAQIVKEKQMEALGRVEPLEIEPPAETLRRRLTIAQNLIHVGPESLGVKDLQPIDHWPDDNYLEPSSASVPNATLDVDDGPGELSLIDALQVAARNSHEYQARKESVFRAALRLEREQDLFRRTFSGSLDGSIDTDLGDERVTGTDGSLAGGISRSFKTGLSLMAQIGLDIARLLQPEGRFSKAVYFDSSISIPLLRGAGRHIVTESLTQAERDVVYAIRDFERFKRSFAVRVADIYLSVLQEADRVRNSADSYRGFIASARYVRRRADAGQLTSVDVGQAVQRELSAQSGWIAATQNFERRKDEFKMLLGLPTDALIELDREELERLTASTMKNIAGAEKQVLEEEIPAANVPIVLVEPTHDNAGPLELQEDCALELALENRLDLRTELERVQDAQRAVVVAADRLRPELTLLGSADVGAHRSSGSADQSDSTQLDFDEGFYSALLSVDLPLERTNEKIAYRESLIALEASVRDLQALEDQIKLDVRNRLRTLLQSRIGVGIEAQALELAKSRVEDSNLRLQAGLAVIRDLLEAQDALLSTQNGLTSAIINYRIAELDLQRDLGLLQVNEKGLWQEYSPQEANHE